VISGEAANYTNFMVFGLNQPGLESEIYCTCE